MIFIEKSIQRIALDHLFVTKGDVRKRIIKNLNLCCHFEIFIIYEYFGKRIKSRGIHGSFLIGYSFYNLIVKELLHRGFHAGMRCFSVVKWLPFLFYFLPL